MKNGSRIAREIAKWFNNHGLPLFFREQRNPYTIWILEVMGQQTQLSRAVSYLERWLAVFPDITSLARAEEREVLKLWEGLGYYSRARNILKAARRVAVEFNGIFPETYDAILSLPGVGEYTAAAIASTVFGEAVPAVDANVRRVFARLLLYEGDATSSVFLGLVQQEMRKMFATVLPGTLNEGVMEFGERICTRKNPDCGCCPVVRWCVAFGAGAVGRIPVPRKRADRIDRVYAVFLLTDSRGRILLVSPSEGGIWPGLWSLPRIHIEESPSLPALEELFLTEYSAEVHADSLLAPVRHAYTRYRLLFYPVSCRLVGREAGYLHAVPPEELPRLPFPSGMLKVLDAFGIHPGSPF